MNLLQLSMSIQVFFLNIPPSHSGRISHLTLRQNFSLFYLNKETYLTVQFLKMPKMNTFVNRHKYMQPLCTMRENDINLKLCSVTYVTVVYLISKLSTYLMNIH